MKVVSTTSTTAILTSVFLPFATIATAQVTPDGTTSTTVNSTPTGFQIEDGDRAGSNLFHSFGDFSVPTGREAYFNNTNDIVNIFSRITGGNISNIDGLLRANGTANLFLINPAGILFGPNASLQLGGSFFGSTADSIVFPDGEFSATDLENPPLITINAPIGLGFRDNPGEITNTSSLGLAVSEGKTFSLIGGNVSSNSGLIFASGANVWLGGLEESGKIQISEDNTLTFPENIARATVSFTNNSFLSVAGANGGSININAKNLEITSGTNFFAGINIESGSPEAQAGDIVINLTEDFLIDGAGLGSEAVTLITNSNFGTGNAGNIEVNARNINFKNGGSISGNNVGQGNIGDITLKAKGNITFDGIKTFSLNERQTSSRSGIFNVVLEGATGNVGKTNIQAQNLSVTNGGQIFSAVAGTADSGDINLNITDTITIDGLIEGLVNDETITLSSFVASKVLLSGTGNSGNININTKNLVLSNSGQINSSIEGIGSAGSISIGNEQAPIEQISLTNGAQIIADTFSQGDAGDLSIFANNLKIDGGESDILTGLLAQVNTDSTGEGGNIFIGNEQFPIEQISLTNGAQVSVSTFSEGDAGDLSIFANNLEIDGGENGIFTGLSAQVGKDASGNAGILTIGSQQSPAEQINLNNGAQILVNTFGQGDAGDFTLFANNLKIDGGENGILTVLSAQVEPGATGEGGSITIGSEQSPIEQISLTDGAQVSVSTFSQGKAGNLSIFANNLEIDGGENGILSGLFAQVGEEASGNAGTVTIGGEKSSVEQINLNNGAQILVNTFGEGDAGTLSIFANNLAIDGGAKGIITGLGASVEEGATGKGGNIFIGNEQFSTQQLILNNRAQILVNTFGQGDAGTLSIFANNLELDGGIDGFLTGLFASVESGATGKGGSILIGNEQFPTQQLTLNNGSQIISNTFSQGNAGDLFIFANNIDINGIGKFPSGLFAEVGKDATGNAGDVNVTSSNLTIRNGATINVNSQGQGVGGNLIIDTDNLNLNSGSLSASTAFGQGGNITLEVADNIILRNNSLISAQATNEASGGNLNIDTNFIIAYPNTGAGNDIIASAGKGRGGNIVINAEGLLNIEENDNATDRNGNLISNGNNDIDASSDVAGLSGNVTINTPDSNPIRDNRELTQNVVASTVETKDACSVSETGEIETSGGLVVKGKGGVPPEPTEPLDADNLIVDGETTSNSSQNNSSQNNNNVGTFHGTPLQNPEEIPSHIQPVAYRDNGEPIYLARGVIVQEDGEIILTAYPTQNTQSRTPQQSSGCD
jgi:filamentous hemagglutinin family protein